MHKIRFDTAVFRVLRMNLTTFATAVHKALSLPLKGQRFNSHPQHQLKSGN